MSRKLGLLLLIACAHGLEAATHVSRSPANRLTYLEEVDPFHPHRDFPKLTTPQWVGEKGVDAVVTFGIDDMRGPEKYEAFLRPILERLKKIDGRAPVSIFTNAFNPDHPQAKTWLEEGLTIEVHTLTHPCPLLQQGNFRRASEVVHGGLDLLARIPGNHPVAYRMPCCDSMNSLSPRFFAEIFERSTSKGNYLQIDSSVFNVFTPRDKSVPRQLVVDPDGKERFGKYLEKISSYVGTIEDYPYPYVINRKCWEFPCAVPSDWEAQNLIGNKNPQMLEDWKRALDVTVFKQGVMNLCFHPHGWSSSEQFVSFINYAEEKYGGKVKFLNFKECLDRLNKHLLGNNPLRQSDGGDNGVAPWGLRESISGEAHWIWTHDNDVHDTVYCRYVSNHVDIHCPAAAARYLRDYTGIFAQVRGVQHRHFVSEQLLKDPIHFLFESGGMPIWQDATGYLDASFKYRLTANFELSIQGSNLLGTDTVLFQQVDNTGLLKPNSWFKNDRRIQFGIRYTM